MNRPANIHGPATAATAVDAEAPPRSHVRDEIDARYRWDLRPIFAGWEEWEQACDELGELVDRLARLQGTLAQGPAALLAVLRLQDELGQLAHRVWYYPSLSYDQDQRDNAVNAKRQRVQVLFARWEQAGAWFKPELLQVPLATVNEWMDADPVQADGTGGLALYRFKLEDLYRRQEHVLGEEGERVLSFTSRFADLPDEAYSALSTADIRYPAVRLSDGREVTVSYGQYRTLLSTHRVQRDRAAVFASFYETFEKSLNTYAALYNGVCQRDWFGAMARRYKTTLEAALDGNRIPTEVVERLIETTRAGVAPLQRYHRLRRRVLGAEVSGYHLYDTSIPLLEGEKRYPYDEAARWVIASASPLGADYQQRVRAVFDGRYVDVYENAGKRSGAYSAGVYGVHPYMLLNYNDTLDDLFTLAHETGHTLHSLLSHESQPFTYASYTIFVAEVASTLSEALLLDALLAEQRRPARARAATAARHRQHHRHLLHPGAVRRVGARSAPRRRARRADHRRDAVGALLRAAAALLRRRHRARLALPHHLGAHPALLPEPVLRLPVRDELRGERADRAGAARGGGRQGARRGGRALPASAARRRQRLPHRPAARGRRRPGAARAGGGGGRRARSPGGPARRRAGGAVAPQKARTPSAPAAAPCGAARILGHVS